MEALHKIEYKVRDLKTRSVILFPTQAQITREIKDVSLKTGTNEIIIVGLSPTIDQDSIKVEGNGDAIITDIAVESLPNRDIFEEIYPETDEEPSDKDEDDEDDDDEDWDEKDNANVLAARDRLTQLNDELNDAENIITSGNLSLEVLRHYGGTLEAKMEGSLASELQSIKEEHAKASSDVTNGIKKSRDITTEIKKAAKELARAEQAQKKERAKAKKEKKKLLVAKAKDLASKARRKEERRKEQLRVRTERLGFWPKNCYTVRITVDVGDYTPASSRRASISSEAELVKPASPVKTGDDNVVEKPWSCDLLLSYVTSSAYWAPSYDLQLSTTNSTGSLCFDAQLYNSTSETWANSKVTLSTSQTAFSGLKDAIPQLVPWSIKLAGKYSNNGESNITRSQEEASKNQEYRAQQHSDLTRKPRAGLFGVSGTTSAATDHRQRLRELTSKSLVKKKQNMARVEEYSRPIAPALPVPTTSSDRHQSGPFSMSAARSFSYAGGGGPGRANADQRRVGHAAPACAAAAYHSQDDEEEEDDDEDVGYGLLFGGDGATLKDVAVDDAVLDFQDSLVEETGFTTSYDLPGLKTLAPKTASSKQRVARIAFRDVIFSHTVVAKYKPVAYLKAKLKNNSKLTLLKGQAGLTLDGSFMGKTALPRCSSGDFFTLSLGVDPAIKVMYPKPDVRRATTGLFTKEDSSVYVRNITLQNTRASAVKPATLLVLDQIPVSQDERLRVELLTPRGLSVGGGNVASGVPGRDIREDKDWGRASASLKAGGEVNWQVSLNAGRAVRLPLEYVVTMPNGDGATQCWTG